MLWIENNLATIMISIIILAGLGRIIHHMWKEKRAGKSACGCSCGSCPMSGSCHTKS